MAAIVINTILLASEHFDFSTFASNWWEQFREDCAPIILRSDGNANTNATFKDIYCIRELVHLIYLSWVLHV